MVLREDYGNQRGRKRDGRTGGKLRRKDRKYARLFGDVTGPRATERATSVRAAHTGNGSDVVIGAGGGRLVAVGVDCGTGRMRGMFTARGDVATTPHREPS